MIALPRPYDFLTAPPINRRGITESVTDILRKAIVYLQFEPGEVLDKNMICDRLVVSRFPVSEALARLQAEGLVDIYPQRGSVVSLVRFADVREFMLIRKALESEVVRVLAGNHDDQLKKALGSNLERQCAACSEDDRAGMHELDLEFHDQLSLAVRYVRFKSMIDSARANLDRARRLIISPRRLEVSLIEHQAIFKAIVAGDAIAASAAMRSHIDSVMRELLDFARHRPEFFADGRSLNESDLSDVFQYG